jgi:hypothetical protein
MPPPQEMVTVLDPCHPLFGRTLPCVGIANVSYQGRCCIVWIRPTIERHVPITATNLAYDPATLYPLPISVESLQQFLQEFQLASAAWKGDLIHDDSAAADALSRAESDPTTSDQPEQSLDHAQPGPTSRGSPGIRHHVSGMSARSQGGQP